MARGDLAPGLQESTPSSVSGGPAPRGRVRRLAERESDLSTAAQLPKTNRIVAGKFWTADAKPGAVSSIADGVAESLRLKLDDALTFDIAGTPVTGAITSLR